MKKDKPINLRMNSEVKTLLEKKGFSMQKIFDWALSKLIVTEKETVKVREVLTESEGEE